MSPGFRVPALNLGLTAYTCISAPEIWREFRYTRQPRRGRRFARLFQHCRRADNRRTFRVPSYIIIIIIIIMIVSWNRCILCCARLRGNGCICTTRDIFKTCTNKMTTPMSIEIHTHAHLHTHTHTPPTYNNSFAIQFVFYRRGNDASAKGLSVCGRTKQVPWSLYMDIIPSTTDILKRAPPDPFCHINNVSSHKPTEWFSLKMHWPIPRKKGKTRTILIRNRLIP